MQWVPGLLNRNLCQTGTRGSSEAARAEVGEARGLGWALGASRPSQWDATHWWAPLVLCDPHPIWASDSHEVGRRGEHSLPAVCRWRDGGGQEAPLAAPAAPGVTQQGRCSARVPPRAATPQPGPWAPALAQSRDLGRCPLPALCPGTCGGRQEVGAGKPTGASRPLGPRAPFTHPKTQEPRASAPPGPLPA